MGIHYIRYYYAVASLVDFFSHLPNQLISINWLSSFFVCFCFCICSSVLHYTAKHPNIRKKTLPLCLCFLCASTAFQLKALFLIVCWCVEFVPPMNILNQQELSKKRKRRKAKRRTKPKRPKQDRRVLKIVSQLRLTDKSPSIFESVSPFLSDSLFLFLLPWSFLCYKVLLGVSPHQLWGGFGPSQRSYSATPKLKVVNESFLPSFLSNVHSCDLSGKRIADIGHRGKTKHNRGSKEKMSHTIRKESKKK